MSFQRSNRCSATLSSHACYSLWHTLHRSKNVMFLVLFCTIYTTNYLLSELQYSSLQMSMSGKGSPLPMSSAVVGCAGFPDAFNVAACFCRLPLQLPLLFMLVCLLFLACLLKLQLGFCCCCRRPWCCLHLPAYTDCPSCCYPRCWHQASSAKVPAVASCYGFLVVYMPESPLFPASLLILQYSYLLTLVSLMALASLPKLSKTK